MVKVNMDEVRQKVEQRAKDVYYGKTLRKSFARYQEILEMPNLLEVQKTSYQWFLDTGLRDVFKDVGAIGDYHDPGRYLCHQRCRACHRLSDRPFPRYVLCRQQGQGR